MADDGAISHLGRKDDMLNAGGFRVAPAEIEAAFQDLPGMLACVAVEVEPVADTRIIALFYEAACEIDPGALRQCAERGLARWKQPRHYQRVARLPRTATGKLRRREVANAYRKAPP
jgi:acyl-coenzyme A synthetase/AMP-(fatty) acid ligase